MEIISKVSFKYPNTVVSLERLIFGNSTLFYQENHLKCTPDQVFKNAHVVFQYIFCIYTKIKKAVIKMGNFLKKETKTQMNNNKTIS